MIKQSILNKFDKKYVKANVGDLWDSEGLSAPEAKTELNADEKLFDSLNKLFLSSLNLNEPGMNYGALKVIARAPFSYQPLIKLLGVKRDAEKKFLEGQTNMTAYFMEMKRIFDEDIRIEDPEGRDEFIKWFLGVASENPTMTGVNNRPMAQMIWNKLLKLYTQFIRLAIEGLGGSTEGMSSRPDKSRSWKAGTVGPQISEFFIALGSPFKEYVSDFGRDYVLNLLDSVDPILTDFLTKGARTYSNTAQYSHKGLFETQKNMSNKLDFLEKFKASPLFDKISTMLKSEMISFRVALEASKLETKDRAKNREKTETSGLSTDGHDQMFWSYLANDLDLKYTILTDLGLGKGGNIGNRDAIKIFLTALKEADSELYMDFSRGVRGAIKTPEGTDEKDKSAVVNSQVNAFKESDTYKRSVDAAKSMISRSRSRKPSIDLSVELDSNDVQRKDAADKLSRALSKKDALIAKIKTLKNPANIEAAEKVLKDLEVSIDKQKELAKKLGVKL